LNHLFPMKTIIGECEPPITASRAPRLTGTPLGRALQIKTILVPLDFSRASIQALKFAIPFAKEFEATIHLVHVQPADKLTEISNAGGLMLNCMDAIALMQDRLREALRQQGRFCPDNCHVVSGRPFEEICKLAREIEADLIVLPTRGLGRLKRIILGSTAEQVVRHAPCPVLIPRGAEFKSITWNGAAATTDFELREILVPVDFTKCSLAGVKYAARLAKGTGATLRLLHVVFPYPQLFAVDRVGAGLTPLIKTAKARAREEMSELLEMSFLRGIPCETEIQTGPVIDEICGESSRTGIDLVVTSTHGCTGFKHAVIGSVAEHLVRYAECPVIIIPSRGCD
jgi:nucleotide-binding universal stress UspA family protein